MYKFFIIHNSALQIYDPYFREEKIKLRHSSEC